MSARYLARTLGTVWAFPRIYEGPYNRPPYQERVRIPAGTRGVVEAQRINLQGLVITLVCFQDQYLAELGPTAWVGEIDE